MKKIQKKIKPLLNPRIDRNFKSIFTQDREESRIALKSFLSAMIGETITKVTVKENEVNVSAEVVRRTIIRDTSTSETSTSDTN